MGISEESKDKKSIVWKQFIEGDNASNFDLIPPIIASSWKRSRKYGIDPYLKRVPIVCRGDSLSNLLKNNHELIQASIPFLASLYSMVKGSGVLTALFDFNGYLLEIIGDDDVVAISKQRNFTVGALWDEKSAGTCALALTIEHDIPIHIILSSVAVYLFIILALRLFGKKELAQLSVYDLVFILLISNAVQNAMVGPDSTLTGGLIAATSLFLVNFILKKLQFNFPKFGKAIQGEAIMLVFHGEILSAHLKSAGITEDELMEVVREHGFVSVADVDLAVLEVDGNISVLSTDIRKKTTRRRKAHKIISKHQ